MESGGGGGRGVTRAQFLLGMCRRPLKTPRPHLLKSLPFSNFRQAFSGATHKFKTKKVPLKKQIMIPEENSSSASLPPPRSRKIMVRPLEGGNFADFETSVSAFMP